MGLDDRDYMQDEQGFSPRGAWAVAGISHKLIVFNCLVWVAWWFPAAGEFMQAQFTVSWSGVFEHYRVWTLLTYAFSHVTIWHLLWNMLFLHWFGPSLEQIYGKRNFLVLYLYAAVVSGLAHAGYTHIFAGFPALGADSAILAVVLVTAIFYPQRTILLFFVMPMPLWLLAAIKILTDLIGMFGPGAGTGQIGDLAGALAGAFFWHFDLRIFGSPGSVRRGSRGLFAGLLTRWRAKKVGLTVHQGGKAAKRITSDVASRVDDLLRKIHAEGMDSLTDEERTFLEGASGHYRRR